MEMEFVKMVGKFFLALLVLAVLASLFGCSSSLEVSSGVTSLDEVSKTRTIALEQIAYLRESSGDSVVREQMILQIEKALADQMVSLLGREKSARFNLNTSDVLQAPEIFREFQATERNLEFSKQPPSPSDQLNGMIVNRLNEPVVVQVKGPNNWSLERSIKERDKAEIFLPAYGNYSVVFVSGNRRSEILFKPVMPNKDYVDENGVRYDLIATAWY